MKRLAIILVLAFVAAGAGFSLVAMRRATQERALAKSSGADLAWLRSEFHLDDQQFAAISALHAAYSGVCAKHCADVIAAQKRLDALRAASASAAEIESATRALADVQAVCNNATREHVRKVAALMSRDQGARYLAVVEPHLAQSPHDGMRGMAH